MSEVSFDFLARRAQAGDAHARAQLVAQMSKTVTGCANRYFTVGGDFNDLVQEGYIGLMSALRTWESQRGPFAPFAGFCIERTVQTAVTRSCRQKYRMLNEAKRFEDHRPDADDDRPLIDPADPNTVERIVETRETLGEIIWAIHDNLSDAEREALTAFLGGLTYEEIVEKTGRTPRAVDNAMQRARRKLRAVA